MLGKKSRPLLGLLTVSPVSGSWAWPMDVLMSKNQSPRGVKNYDLGGVGLGIVAALEESIDKGIEIPASKVLYSRNFYGSKPIPVKNSARFRGGFEEMDLDSLEDYTFVTYCGTNKSHTKVYYDGGEYRRSISRDDKIQSDRRSNTSCRSSVFDISSAIFGDFSVYPTSEFLSSCHLCQKNLHGKDIYMYRGDKAFCSTECRYKQIVMDECKKQCSSEASRSADVSNSPCKNGQIFSTGILAI